MRSLEEISLYSQFNRVHEEKRETLSEEDIRNIYTYYNEGGWFRIFLRKISGLLIFAFIAILLYIFVGSISYREMFRHSSQKNDTVILHSFNIESFKGVKNSSNEEFKTEHNIKIVHPLKENRDLKDYLRFKNPSWYHIVYIIIVSLTLIFRMFLLIALIPILVRMKFIYGSHLRIPDSSLHIISWDDVTQRLIECTTLRLISRDGEALNVLDLANIIMRKENYMIALVHHNVADFRNLTSNFDSNFQHCVLDILLNTREGNRLLLFTLMNKNKTTLQFKTMYNSTLKMLKTKMRLMALIRLAISPFNFIYTLIHFILEYGEKVYSDPRYLGSKNWTIYASYKFRDYNELSHLFSARLNSGTESMMMYIDYLSPIKWEPVYRVLIFMFGSILVLFLLLNLITNNLLLETKLYGINILTYITFLGVSIAILKSLIKIDRPVDVSVKLKNTVEDLQSKLRYLPLKWVETPYSIYRTSEISTYYSYQLLSLALSEIVSPIMTPIRLLLIVNRLDVILTFLIDHTTFNERTGYICSFASFSNSFGEDKEENREEENKILNNSESKEDKPEDKGKNILRISDEEAISLHFSDEDSLYKPLAELEQYKNRKKYSEMFSELDDSKFLYPDQVIDESKLKQSILNFQLQHPQWYNK
jgi:autophagy-related protein 9